MISMGAVVVALKVIFQVGGQAINMIYDKSKKMFVKEDFNTFVENYNLTGSVSVLSIPIISPNKSFTDQDDQKAWVAIEVARLNKQHEDIFHTLQGYKKKNEEQGRMMALYNHERLTRPPQQQIALLERPTNAQITLPGQRATAQVALLEPPTTATEQAHTHTHTTTVKCTDGKDRPTDAQTQRRRRNIY